MPSSPKSPKFVIQREEWTSEDDERMRELCSHGYWSTFKKLLQCRMITRTEELVNGKETRPQLMELQDLSYQLYDYENPQGA